MPELPRPPQLTAHHAAAFQLESVVASYRTRPVYPPEVAPFLTGLISAPGARVLELGCGTGELARALAPLVVGVDAIDISEPMLRAAREMPGGNHPAIRWILGPAEEFPPGQEYALAVAGDSLHWMDWDVLLPRLARELAPGAVLVIASVASTGAAWEAPLLSLIQQFSTAQEWQRYDLVELLASRSLFRLVGNASFAARTEQPVEEYIESFHARATLARERMGARALEFDSALRILLRPYAVRGRIALEIRAELRWGAPLAGRAG